MMDEISNALRSLKMPGMAHYWTTMQETRQHDSLSLKDGLQLLIQAELDNRTTSRNTRLVKKARFRYQASIGEVIYDSKRGVDKQKVLNLQRSSDPVIFRTACETALRYGRYSYKFIRSLVESNCAGVKQDTSLFSPPEHDNIRGHGQFR